MGETTDQAAHRAYFKCGISNLNLIRLDKNNCKNWCGQLDAWYSLKNLTGNSGSTVDAGTLSRTFCMVQMDQV